MVDAGSIEGWAGTCIPHFFCQALLFLNAVRVVPVSVFYPVRWDSCGASIEYLRMYSVGHLLSFDHPEFRTFLVGLTEAPPAYVSSASSLENCRAF